MSDTPPPGVYQDVPMSEYAKWEAVNYSRYLKPLHTHSPKRAKWESERDRDDTASMAFGRYVHTAILEPHLLDERYAVAPKVDRRTKEGKAAWAEFCESCDGKEVVTEADAEAVVEIMANIREHPVASEILAADGASEVSMLWEDHGTLCKARVDRVCLWRKTNAAIDLKTTKDASPEGFAREVARYGYGLQAAHYLDGAAAWQDVLFPDRRKNRRAFIWLAVENSPPFDVGVYVLDDEDARAFRARRRGLMGELERCRESGEWPGYTWHGAENLLLPAWAK